VGFQGQKFGFVAFNQSAVEQPFINGTKCAFTNVCLPGKRSRTLSRHTRLSGDTQFRPRPGALWLGKAESTSTSRCRHESMRTCLEFQLRTLACGPFPSCRSTERQPLLTSHQVAKPDAASCPAKGTQRTAETASPNAVSVTHTTPGGQAQHTFDRLQLSYLAHREIWFAPFNSARPRLLLAESPSPLPHWCHPDHRQSEIPNLDRCPSLSSVGRFSYCVHLAVVSASSLRS